MNVKRFYYLMLGIVFILCVGLVSLLVVSNHLFKSQSSKLAQAKAETQAVENQKVSLSQAKKDVEKYTELNEIAKSVVPQDKDQAKTIREINAIAAESGVKIDQISFETSNLGQKPATAPTANESGESAPSAPKPPSITQVKPVAGINGVYSLAITIRVGQEVSYYRFLQFLEKLENNRRTAHVSNIVVSPVKGSSNVTFSLTLNAYLKP